MFAEFFKKPFTKLNFFHNFIFYNIKFSLSFYFVEIKKFYIFNKRKDHKFHFSFGEFYDYYNILKVNHYFSQFNFHR